MMVLPLRTPVAQHSDRPRVVGIIGYDHSAFAIRTEVLSRIEAEAAHVPQAPGPTPFVLGTVRLTGILDHREAASPAISRMGSMSAGCPYRCTGTIAFVFSVMAASMEFVSIL